MDSTETDALERDQLVCFLERKERKFVSCAVSGEIFPTEAPRFLQGIESCQDAARRKRPGILCY